MAAAAQEILANYDRPTWWQKRLAHRVIGPWHQRRFGDRGVNVLDREWDVLIVLDGCRADLFSNALDMQTLRRFDVCTTVDSLGGATNEWCRRTFNGDALTDTIYVTANPVVSRETQTPFYRFVECWRDDFDQKIGTVPAEPVTDAAVEQHERHPDKRLIVHYLQPHYPFVGRPDLQFADWGQTDDMVPDHVNDGANDIWEAVGLGLVDRDEAWDAYAENLRYAMDSVERLLTETSGRRLITSDHGNCIGERVAGVPMYGHCPGIYHRALRRVPWAIVDDRSDQTARDDADVETRLRRLGYVD